MSYNGQTIEIVTREDESEYSSRGSRVEMVSEQVDVSVLRDRFQAFLASLRNMIDVDLPGDLPFELEEIQFSAEITASGEFKLLGAGVGLEIGSAVTFVLQRRSDSARQPS